MPDTESGTKDWFSKKFGALDDDTYSKLVSVQNLFNLSNDDIYVKWEAFAVTHENGDLDLSTVNVDRFQLHLQDAISKRSPAMMKIKDLTKRKQVMGFSSSPGVVLPNTPQLKRRKPTLSSEPDSSPSRNELPSSPRKTEVVPSPGANTILETLNHHIELGDSATEVHLSANFDAEKYKFRTMARKLLESADVLDEQIDNFSQQFLEMYKDKDIQLGNPCMSSQFDIVCCGRMVPDSPHYDSMILQSLNDKSLFLETSRLGGIGQRIPLDLSSLPEFSLFPGQIVGFRGRNPTGRTFVVHEILSLPQLGAPVSSLLELQEFSGVLRTFIAAGPFSNLQTLNYSKLELLVDRLNSEIRPNVAILFGPFLDITNKAVESGDIEVPGVPANQQPKNLDELFKAVVTPILKRIDPKIQVILLPSLKDASSKHTSYPQSSLDRRSLGLPKNFKCFPNPSSFSLNEVMFSASNLDVFKDLKDVYRSTLSSEKSKVPNNRFERIANHIFEQRRYYPVFPGSVKRSMLTRSEQDKLAELAEGQMAEELVETDVGGSSLEVPYMGLAELGDSLPDVLIAPSELQYFAKVIRGVVVINPGLFIRPSRDASKEDGSYVVISVKPTKADDEDNIQQVQDSDLYYHNVYKRARIDIYKS